MEDNYKEDKISDNSEWHFGVFPFSPSLLPTLPSFLSLPSFGHFSASIICKHLRIPTYAGLCNWKAREVESEGKTRHGDLEGLQGDKVWQGWGWIGASEALTREGASSAYTCMPFQLFSTHLGHMTLIFSLTIMSISPCPQIFKTFKKRLGIVFWRTAPLRDSISN